MYQSVINKTVHLKLNKALYLVFLLFISTAAFSQQKKKVEILYAGYAESDETLSEGSQRLVDSVYIKHKDILMWCDTAYTYTGTNRVDAFGNVHIQQADTVHLYAGKVYYNGDISFAQAINNVRLINKSTTLYADTLDYNLDTNIGYYDDYGKIVDSTNVLTSLIGRYFIDEDLVHFYQDVEAYSDDYTMTGDTMIYNTETGRIAISGPTTIRDSANTLYAEDGWYNTETGEAELLKNPRIFNDKQELSAEYIKYNEEDGNGRALWNVRIHDIENKSIVTGNTVTYNDNMEIATVTDSALFIMYSENDTLFLHADTLRSIPDTIPDEKIVKAFYGARFFRSDIQGIADSLVYFTADSVVQLYQNPVVWSEAHQLSADYIEMIQKTDAPDEMHLNNNSFIISKLDSGRFDQIKGKNMIGYVVDNELKKIDVNGNGQTLYYARDDSTIIGLNRAESANISIQFKDGQVHRIAFLRAPLGQLKPLFQTNEEEKKLTGFEWKVSQRPLSKQDLFGRKTDTPEVPANTALSNEKQ
jgi:lipopolysaccharide export system protein LptA